MLRLLAVCGLLTIVLSLPLVEEEDDRVEDRAWFREQGLSEDVIDRILSQADESTDEEEEEYFSWDYAKGYEECEEFKWKNRKHLENMEEDNEVEEDVKEGDYNEIAQYKYDTSSKERGYHGYRHGQQTGEKKKNCPAKPKPLDKICEEYECPKYEKLNVTGCGFEARRVLAANWVMTQIDSSDMKKGYREAFWRLFKYINGANDQEAEIAMTVPVINQWFLDDNYEIQVGYMAFYIPSAFQASPPAPTDENVFTQRWEDTITYDRAFGGNRDDPEYYKKQFTMLWKALDKADLPFYDKQAITAGYTRPGFGRQRKEVMYSYCETA